jgi:hypothetical protein
MIKGMAVCVVNLISRTPSSGPNSPKRPVFVLNIRVIGLGVTWSLALKGVPVIAIDYIDGSEKLLSNRFT